MTFISIAIRNVVSLHEIPAPKTWLVWLLSQKQLIGREWESESIWLAELSAQEKRIGQKLDAPIVKLAELAAQKTWLDES
jgi:hypothetical protein